MLAGLLDVAEGAVAAAVAQPPAGVRVVGTRHHDIGPMAEVGQTGAADAVPMNAPFDTGPGWYLVACLPGPRPRSTSSS